MYFSGQPISGQDRSQKAVGNGQKAVGNGQKAVGSRQ